MDIHRDYIEVAKKEIIKNLVNGCLLIKKVQIPWIKVFYDKLDYNTIYFMLTGPKDSPFEGGEYIGKIVTGFTQDISWHARLVRDYYMLTPNGKFIVDKKIFIRPSGWYPEVPQLNLMDCVKELYSAFISKHTFGPGYSNESDEVKKEYARKSIEYNEKYLKEINDKIKADLVCR